MAGYWVRHRLLFTIALSVLLSVLVSLLFVFPHIEQKASQYNAQSIYRNTDIDFIVPEPSVDQAEKLPGTNGVKAVFPFYLTTTPVEANGKSRDTTIIIAEESQNTDITMYNTKRLIQSSEALIDHPIYVDWQFLHDTNSHLGDSISFNIGDDRFDCSIAAVYETNSIYDGGAVLVQLPHSQIEKIRQRSVNNGYSAMYVLANDYDACQSYLTTDYRPLGRLKNRDQFKDDEAYQIHYEAIVSSDYSNEITDFRVRKNSLNDATSIIRICLSVMLTILFLIGFNWIMAQRGCEYVYFTRHCIPKGQDIKPYYTISFVAEIVLCLLFYFIVMMISIRTSRNYIPSNAIGVEIIVVPISVIICEIACLFFNRSRMKVEDAKARNSVE